MTQTPTIPDFVRRYTFHVNNIKIPPTQRERLMIQDALAEYVTLHLEQGPAIERTMLDAGTIEQIVKMLKAKLPDMPSTSIEGFKTAVDAIRTLLPYDTPDY